MLMTLTAPPQGWAQSTRTPKLTADLVKQAKSLRAAGQSYRQIAFALGVSKASAVNWVRR